MMIALQEQSEQRPMSVSWRQQMRSRTPIRRVVAGALCLTKDTGPSTHGVNRVSRD